MLMLTKFLKLYSGIAIHSNQVYVEVATKKRKSSNSSRHYVYETWTNWPIAGTPSTRT